MIESKLERVEEYSLERCQGVTGIGQCPYKVSEGSKFCAMHGGNMAAEIKAKESLRVYRLAKWSSRVNEIADHDKIKSLREEIGILRVVLEETINMCNDSAELLLYASRISDTVAKIERLVASCHRLEAATGATLDKQQALQLASVMVEIISRYVTDQEAIDSVSNEIVTAILSSSKIVELK